MRREFYIYIYISLRQYTSTDSHYFTLNHIITYSVEQRRYLPIYFSLAHRWYLFFLLTFFIQMWIWWTRVPSPFNIVPPFTIVYNISFVFIVAPLHNEMFKNKMPLVVVARKYFLFPQSKIYPIFKFISIFFSFFIYSKFFSVLF